VDYIFLSIIIVVGVVLYSWHSASPGESWFKSAAATVLETSHLIAGIAIITVSPIGIYYLIRYEHAKTRGAEIESDRLARDVERLKAAEALNRSIADQQQDLAAFVGKEVRSALASAGSRSTVASDASGHPGLDPTLSPSVLGERLNHFREEKETLCDVLFRILIERIVTLRGVNDRAVFVLIDSGSTLFPLFRRFGRWAVSERIASLAENPQTLGRFRLITNSVAGIAELAIHGRLSDDDRYSELALKAELIGGVPLAVYSATVGPSAIRYLTELKSMPIRDVAGGDKNNRPNPYVIGITTGNYIFLGKDHGDIRMVARGDGHREFKEALCNVSDEIFVVGPLGKFVAETSDIDLELFNQKLGYELASQDLRRRPYEYVNVSGNLDRVHAITTFRPFVGGRNYLLQTHGAVIKSRLEANGRHVVEIKDKWSPGFYEAIRLAKTATLDGLGHIVLEFQDIPGDVYEQLKMELPHENVRTSEVRDQFFGVKM
jgi:hypothetical protein